MEDDKNIFIVQGDLSKLITPFPVFNETGNAIIFVYSLRKLAKTRKRKLTNIFL